MCIERERQTHIESEKEGVISSSKWLCIRMFKCKSEVDDLGNIQRYI